MKNTIAIILVSFFFSIIKMEGAITWYKAGYEIRHEWVSDSTYKIFVTEFRRCDVSYLDTLVSLCILDSCNSGFQYLLYLNKDTIMSDGSIWGSELKKTCPNFSTFCDSLLYPYSVNSYRRYEYSGLFTLSEICNYWEIRINSLNGSHRRDTLLTNIQAGHWFYEASGINCQDTNIKNKCAKIINSTPFFAPKNENFSYSLKAIDPDGDSLVYHLIPSKDKSYQCNAIPVADIPFVFSFSINEPFNTSGTFYWDSLNAIINFTAPVAQNPLITLRIDEYRNGVWVGNTWWDIPIMISSYNNPLPQSINLPATNVNTVLMGTDSFYTCAGTTMSFCSMIHSMNASAAIDISSTLSGAIPFANMSTSNNFSDSVLLCFTWSPTLLDTGWHTFTITARDTTCPPIGVNTPQTFAYRIFVSSVGNNVTQINDQACNHYQWNGQTYTTSGVYNYTYSNMNGCDSVVELNLTIIQLNNTVIQSGFSLWSSVPSAQYQWINCDTNVPIAGENNQGFVTTIGGNYAVIVNQFGCLDTSNCVSINSLNNEDQFTGGNILISPNPTSGKINVSFDKLRNYNTLKLVVTNILGEQVYSNSCPIGQQQFSLDFDRWPSGQYFFKFIADDELLGVYKLTNIE